MRVTSRQAVPVILCLLAVTGCGSSGGGEEQTTTAAGAGVLATADSDLGEIVVDADGRTVYVFDRDTAGSGTSSCTDTCLENWPAVTAADEDPVAEGVTGDVGTIERDDGTRQVTLDGLPLYTYVGDSDPGSVTGQGVQGVWWVVSPDGARVTQPPEPPEPSDPPADLGY